MAKTNQSSVPAFGMKDKLGYMFGDFGNDFTFILSSTFMMKFYTDVMGLSAGVVGMLMMAARFVDAFSDVTMGQIVDRSKPTKDGKFRPWIKRMCGPVAIASFLIFQAGFADMSYGFKVAWMVITYLLWGSVFYTAINIPYGSMASAISAEPNDRASLSTWRTIGSTLASLVIGAGTPLVAYVTVDGNPVLSGSRMTIIAGIFSVCAVICYVLCFKLVRERVPVPANNQKFDLAALGKNLITNRALVGIIVAALLLLLAMLGMQGMSAYVFPNCVSEVRGAQSAVVSLLSNIAVHCNLCASGWKTGSQIWKERALGCSFLSDRCGQVIWFVSDHCIRIMCGSTLSFYVLVISSDLDCFNMVIWAMITDVIDDAEVKNGMREDGTIYAVYSFRKKTGSGILFRYGRRTAVTGQVIRQATAFEPASYRRASLESPVSYRSSGLTAVALALILHLSTEQKTCGRKLCRIGKTQRRKIRRNENRELSETDCL